jgi:hypothetical protein
MWHHWLLLLLLLLLAMHLLGICQQLATTIVWPC